MRLSPLFLVNFWIALHAFGGNCPLTSPKRSEDNIQTLRTMLTALEAVTVKGSPSKLAKDFSALEGVLKRLPLDGEADPKEVSKALSDATTIITKMELKAGEVDLVEGARDALFALKNYHPTVEVARNLVSIVIDLRVAFVQKYGPTAQITKLLDQSLKKEMLRDLACAYLEAQWRGLGCRPVPPKDPFYYNHDPSFTSFNELQKLSDFVGRKDTNGALQAIMDSDETPLPADLLSQKIKVPGKNQSVPLVQFLENLQLEVRNESLKASTKDRLKLVQFMETLSVLTNEMNKIRAAAGNPNEETKAHLEMIRALQTKNPGLIDGFKFWAKQYRPEQYREMRAFEHMENFDSSVGGDWRKGFGQFHQSTASKLRAYFASQEPLGRLTDPDRGRAFDTHLRDRIVQCGLLPIPHMGKKFGFSELKASATDFFWRLSKNEDEDPYTVNCKPFICEGGIPDYARAEGKRASLLCSTQMNIESKLAAMKKTFIETGKICENDLSRSVGTTETLQRRTQPTEQSEQPRHRFFRR